MLLKSKSIFGVDKQLQFNYLDKAVMANFLFAITPFTAINVTHQINAAYFGTLLRSIF